MAKGQPPPRGGKGDRPVGGARGDPRSPCAPPQHDLDGKPWRTGESETPAGWRHVEGGAWAQGEAQRKPNHQGECPPPWGWGEKRTGDGGGREGEGEGGRVTAEAVMGVGVCGLAAGELGTDAEVDTAAAGLEARVGAVGSHRPCGRAPPQIQALRFVPAPWLRGCGLDHRQGLKRWEPQTQDKEWAPTSLFTFRKMKTLTALTQSDTDTWPQPSRRKMSPGADTEPTNLSSPSLSFSPQPPLPPLSLCLCFCLCLSLSLCVSV